jgi:hypothetical protein
MFISGRTTRTRSSWIRKANKLVHAADALADVEMFVNRKKMKMKSSLHDFELLYGLTPQKIQELGSSNSVLGGLLISNGFQTLVASPVSSTSSIMSHHAA